MVESGARGKLIHEKNLMSKISCQIPFKNLAFASLTPEFFFMKLLTGFCTNNEFRVQASWEIVVIITQRGVGRRWVPVYT
jgi:hypothetical protein